MEFDLKKQKEKIISVVNRTYEIMDGIGSSLDMEVLSKIKEKIINDKILIVVCGECKVGKSSMLTEIIGEDNLFPINADVATNNITMISYGEKEEIIVSLEKSLEMTKKGVYKQIDIRREEIEDYVTEQGNKDNHKRVCMIDIKTPNQRLKNGLVLVDTPGVGGLDEAHSGVTAAFIPEADAVIYASEVTKPLDTYELQFMKEYIDPYCDNVVFVATKSDTVAPQKRRTIIDTNRRKIANCTKWKEEDIRITPISSLAMKNYRKKNNKWTFIASNFQELEHLIDDMTTTRRITKMLLPNLIHLKSILSENAKAQITKHNTLITDDQEKIKSLKVELFEYNKKKKELLSKNSNWRLKLNRNIRGMTNELTAFVKSNMRSLKKTINEDMNINCIITDSNSANEYLDELTKKLNNMTVELQNMYNAYTEQMFNEVKEDVELGLTPFKSKGFEIEIDTQSYNSKKMITKTETIYNTTRNVFMSSISGFGVYNVLSFVGMTAVATPVAIAISLAGIFFLGKKALQSSEQNNNNVVNKVALNMVNEANSSLFDLIKESRDNIETYFIIEMENRIKSEIEKYNKIIEDIPTQIENSKEERSKKVKETKIIIDKFKQLIKEVNDLLNNYQSLAEKMNEDNMSKLDEYRRKIEKMKQSSDENEDIIIE